MNPESFQELISRRISSPWAFVLLLIGVSFGYWFLQAQAADRREKPYKYELIEEYEGTRILHGVFNPMIDAHKVFIEKDGAMEPMIGYALSDYVNKKYASESVDAKINHFVRLFNPYKVKTIESVHDIPGYAPDQLDPDVNPDAIKTYSFTINRGRPDHLSPQPCMVKYAWEIMGDIQRFRFEIRKATGEIQGGEVTTVQRQVGNFSGLD